MNSDLTFVLLPGLDGSGLLFEDFVARMPPGFRTRVVRYPGDAVRSYAELESLVREQLPDEPYVLVGESYSGPLAVALAARPRGDLRGLVLVASFVTRPAWRGWRWLPWRALFALPAPVMALRWALGLDGPAGADHFRVAVREASPEVLAARVREALAVDVREELRAVRCPVLYLVAARDRIVAKRCAREVAALRPGAVVETLDAGHPLLQLVPDAAWGRIAAFFGGGPPRESGPMSESGAGPSG
ncbi:MAG: alpha/beta hydrolase [Planctomycetes bacterium]|nr:alpha/beta hydrolase [Planctomycetota bacterium]MCB9904501.1 alpha/beta hydrolase [Planctomycetota bacterium]